MDRKKIVKALETILDENVSIQRVKNKERSNRVVNTGIERKIATLREAIKTVKNGPTESVRKICTEYGLEELTD